MVYNEVWAYPIERIREYFDSIAEESCLACDNSASYTVNLESLPERKVGPISFPQTRVVIEGDSDEEVERVYHAFYLHFLSGGA